MSEEKKKTVYSFSKVEMNIPEWIEFQVVGKKYISWGSDNKMPEFLIDLRDNSAVHNAVLQRKNLYTYGMGLKEGQNISQFNLGQQATLKAIIDDYWLYNMWALNVVWSNDGQTIAHAEHVDMSKLRPGRKNEFGRIDKWYFSNDWNNTRKAENKIVELEAYDPRTPEGSQIFVYHPYSSGFEYFSKPTYWGAINYVALDYELSNWKLNSVRNGFSPSMSIVINDMPETQEERDYIYNELKRQYSGSTNSGEVFLIFSNGENGVQLAPIDTNNSDTKYNDFMQIVRDQILVGHQATNPILFGVATPGSLGGRTELIEAYELMMNTEIKPCQEMFGEMLQKLLKLNFTPEFENLPPVNYAFSESIMKEILTQDEMRDLIGYGPIGEQNSITETIDESKVEAENNQPQ
jgi:hypothetical protein